eukprot:SAG31_NODE_2672_length_5268_cov_41.402273_6_plen_73_part_00
MCYPITQLKNQVKLARVTYDINGTRYYMEHLLGCGSRHIDDSHSCVEFHPPVLCCYEITRLVVRVASASCTR